MQLQKLNRAGEWEEVPADSLVLNVEQGCVVVGGVEAEPRANYRIVISERDVVQQQIKFKKDIQSEETEPSLIGKLYGKIKKAPRTQEGEQNSKEENTVKTKEKAGKKAKK